MQPFDERRSGAERSEWLTTWPPLQPVPAAGPERHSQPGHLPAQFPLQPVPAPGPGQHYQCSTEPIPAQRDPFSPQARRPTGSCALVLGTLLIGLLIGALVGWQFGQSNLSREATSRMTESPSLQTSFEKVAAQFRPSVVQINVQKVGGIKAIGSGVVIDTRGYIVTNNHVVDGSESMDVVFYNARTFRARLTGVDPVDDLAVIQITPPKNIVAASLGDSSKLFVGQSVLAIGNPLGITQTVTSGIVSALGRTVGQGEVTIINAVQTDAAINPGNSGGALVDLNGQLIGVPSLVPIDPTFNTPANGVGFAIPSNRIAFIVPQLIQSGKVTKSGRANLGVNVISNDQMLMTQNNLAVSHGALVVSVVAGSAAERVGIKAGDVIVQVDRTAINTSEELLDVMVKKTPGEMVTLKVYRGSEQLTLPVTLGELQIK
jgi:S1-C subfamily serine protease